MKDAITDKLCIEITRGIETEAQVVYFLVGIRKLIEHSEQPGHWLPLQFFCDWAVHTKLTRQPAFELLRDIDEAIERGETNDQAVARIGRTFSLDAFRDDLIHFLIHHDLPTTAVGTMVPWRTFLRLYLSVVSDCPIQSSKLELKHVDKVILSVCNDPPKRVPDGAAFAYTISWAFWKSDKEVFTWANEVYYPSNYQPGRFYDWSKPRRD
jgi:hypothetical protein